MTLHEVGLEPKTGLLLPEPPTIITFLFRAVFGFLGAVVHCQPFRWVSITLF